MRKPVIAGNWKMHKTASESVRLASQIKALLGDFDAVEVIIGPNFTALKSVGEAIAGSKIGLAAQDLFWEDEGAYTGEVSARMLKDIGCSHVIIGHSERRQFFGETDSGVNKKAKAAHLSGLTPIICVGETLAERRAGSTFAVVRGQIQSALEGMTSDQIINSIIAYEPVWAIGTGVTASPDQAQEVHRFIRSLIADGFGAAAAEGVRIQYGGSVKPDNISELMAQPDIDGALVGGASLSAEDFAKIVRY